VAVLVISESKVSECEGSVQEDGTEDEDGGWKFVGGCGDRPQSDPAVDLRPIGVRYKFWALTDDDDSDEEVAFQSPYMPDLVHHVTVHGFKDQLYEVELALQDSSV
jgi:hypothetical protein